MTFYLTWSRTSRISNIFKTCMHVKNSFKSLVYVYVNANGVLLKEFSIQTYNTSPQLD